MEEKKVGFLEKFGLDLPTLWKNHKVFLIVFGLLILIVKFREVIIDILIGSAKRTMDDAREKDASLRSQEDKANNEADRLVKEAEDLAKDKPDVDEDWHKK